MKQDQIESLKQSQLNLNSIIKAVNVQKLTPENAVRDVMTAQVKSNIANGRHSRYGLDGLNDWVITTQVGKAEDKVKHFQEFAAAITSFDPVQSLASSGDAAIKTAV